MLSQGPPATASALIISVPTWIVSRLTMVRKTFVYHCLGLARNSGFKTMSEGQGCRVFGGREHTIRPSAVENEFAVGVKPSPNIKFIDYGGNSIAGLRSRTPRMNGHGSQKETDPKHQYSGQHFHLHSSS